MNLDSSVVRICPLTAEDVTKIKKLETECRLAPWTINDYLQEASRKDSLSYIAKIRHEVTGFIIARLITSTNHDITIEIYNLCVSPKHRRKKIGKSLVESVIMAVEDKKKKIWLEVRKSNAAAISFYKNMNFSERGTRKNFYCNPVEDALIMERVINKQS